MHYFTGPEYQRVEKMYLYRQLGMPFKQIGKKFDLSTERVRQILEKRNRLAISYIAQQDAAASGVCVASLNSNYNPKTHAVKAALSLADIC